MGEELQWSLGVSSQSYGEIGLGVDTLCGEGLTPPPVKEVS
jgi:hypothetical protein